MANEFVAKNGIIAKANSAITGTLDVSGNITMGTALVATRTWVTSTALSGYATESYVTTAIANLVDSAPGTLDTLNELAAALGDDPNFATTLTNSIATKATYSSGRFQGDLNTLGISTASSGIYSIGEGYTNGPGSTSLYGTLYTFWNVDISVQIWPTYNGDFYWRKSVGAGFAGSTWRTIWDTSHFVQSDINNWNTAYNDRITAASVSGTGTKTLTLTQGDGGTVTATWTDYDTDNDAQTISYSSGTNELSISNGNSITLDGLATEDYVLSQGFTTFQPWNSGTGSINYTVGNVGIGTTSPGRKLTVQGADDGTMQLRLMGTASQTSYWEIGREAQSTGQFRFIASRNGTVITPMVIDDQTGNVGIGTTSPSYKLDVSGTARTTQSTYLGTASGNVIVGGTSSDVTASFKFISIGNSAFQYGASTGNYLRIEPGDANTVLSIKADARSGAYPPLAFFTSDTERLRILANGNVGIGTTSPEYKLDVSSDVRFGGGITLTPITGNLYATDGALSYYSSANGVYLNGAGTNGWLRLNASGVENYQNAIDIYGAAAGGYIIFRTGNNTRVTIANGGNVGIGTESPATKLDVNGVITATGGNSNKWNEAYDWGNHADFGYLTSETDSQNLEWDSVSKNLTITNGNTVTLDGLLTSEDLAAYGYISSESDTLATVTGRGATTTNAITVGSTTINPGYLTLSGASTSVDPELSMTDDSGFGVAGFKMRYGNPDGWTYYDSYWASGGGHRFRTSVASSTIEALTINHNGSVGIGTTTPYGRLELSGSGQSWTTAPAIRMWDSFNEKGWLVGSANNITAGDFYIRTLPSVNGAPSTGQQEFTIKHATGNVGIGTTSPSNKLTVYQGGGVRVTGIASGSYIEISGDLPGYASNSYPVIKSAGTIHFANNGKYSAYIEGNNTYFGILDSSTITRVFLNTAGNSYLTGGNLGIGTTAPQHGLHINLNQNQVAGFQSPNPNTWIDLISTAGTWSMGATSGNTWAIYERGNDGTRFEVSSSAAFISGEKVATQSWVDGQGYLTSLPAHTHTIANVTGLQTALDGKLTTNSDSEQVVGLNQANWNAGEKWMRCDPRWNESGYDAALGTLHIYSSTQTGESYGRAGIALWNDGAYQYLTTKSGTTGLFVNNNEIIHAGNIGSQSVAYATSAGSASTAATVTGKSSISYVAHSAGANDYNLELYSDDTGDATKYVSLRFHQGSRYWGQIRYNNAGFRLTGGADDSLNNIYAGIYYATGGNSSQWNTAYGWGNHASAGYFKLSGTEPITIEAETVTFTGNVEVQGTFTESSSIRFKENIKTLEPVLGKVEELNPVTYNKIGSEDEEIGLIAEEVAELFPEVVTYNEEGLATGVQYQRLSVILLKAVQELTERVNKLENK